MNASDSRKASMREASNYRKPILISSIFWGINGLKEDQTGAFEMDNLLSFTDQICASVSYTECKTELLFGRVYVKSFAVRLTQANPACFSWRLMKLQLVSNLCNNS